MSETNPETNPVQRVVEKARGVVLRVLPGGGESEDRDGQRIPAPATPPPQLKAAGGKARQAARTAARRTSQAASATASSASDAATKVADKLRGDGDDPEKSPVTRVKTTAADAAEATARKAEEASEKAARKADQAVSEGAQTTTAADGTPGSGRPYEQWTKAELYQRAQEREIDGRSTMNKDDLIEALRRTS